MHAPHAATGGTARASGALEPAVRGELESHLTVDCPRDRVDRLAGWAEDRGLSFVHIVLACGRTPSQPMLTLRSEGGLAEHDERIAPVRAELEAAGFPVVRVKTEAAPWAEGVPRTDREAQQLPRTRYFEHHVKLLLPPERSPGGSPDSPSGGSPGGSSGHGRAALVAAVVPHAAHLSWNARRTRADGHQERFVTQRCHGVGGATAARRLGALLGALEEAGLQVVEVEREFVVRDSALGLDAGWITGDGGGAGGGMMGDESEGENEGENAGDTGEGKAR